ncbi:hypothetical protein PSECIP111951_00716 [Pseudoalteromonas holothuriae]|uniref:Wzy n=1 Tax=Pseudoalteromonas holothuriae TaxID=2963714 RepID=A0ABM9GF83_9GAMM|nr:hypothetical protein PSECIP111951_00716 [Pseudoalteromonas sp. CIP111951]
MGLGFLFFFVLLFLLKVTVTKFKFSLDSVFYIVSIYFFAVFFFSLLRVLVLGDNFEFLLSILRGWLTFVSCYFVYYFFLDKNKVVFFLTLCFVVNSVINFSVASNPVLFPMIELFKGENLSSELGYNPFRNSYLSMSGYYTIGTAYGIFSMLLGYTLVKERASFTRMAAFFTVGFSAVIAARTASLAVVAILGYFLSKRLVFIVFSLLMVYAGIYLLSEIDSLQVYKNWVLEGGDKSYIIDVVDAIWIDTSGLNLLYGTGYVNNGLFAYTDSGFLKELLFGGIPYLLLKISLLGIIYFVFKVDKIFSFLLLLVVLVFNFKGQFIFNSSHGMAVFYFIVFYFKSISEGFVGKGFDDYSSDN